MSNRRKVVDPVTGELKKVYIPRAERRELRNARRAAAGSPLEEKVRVTKENKHMVEDRKSYNKLVTLLDPNTGRPMTEPMPAPNGKSAFLIDGVKYVWDDLGGAEGFARWARTHETKFRELSMKLLPEQLLVQREGGDRGVVIHHALPPPRYNAQGTTYEVAKDVTPADVMEAIRKLTPEQKRALLDEAGGADDGATG